MDNGGYAQLVYFAKLRGRPFVAINGFGIAAAQLYESRHSLAASVQRSGFILADIWAK